MRILCGTDFTPNSKQAADVAACLAERLGQTLDLVHVMDESGIYVETGGIPDEMREVAEKALKSEVERLHPRLENLQPELLHGAPDQKISQIIREKGDCSMVIVSSLGRRAPERWIIGSVSSRLAESASVPTLVLRDGSAMLDWLEGRRALRIMVCFDGGLTSEAALRWAVSLTQAGPCEIIAAYINWPVNEQLRLGVKGAMSLTQNQPEVQQVLERDFSAQVKRVAGETPVRLRIEPGFGREDAGLTQLASEEQADLVVIGTHQRKGLDRLWRGSVSRGVLLRSPVSVAVVPSELRECISIPRIQTVLVATGLDETSRCTVAQACSVAPPGSAVHVITVIHPMSLSGPIAQYEVDAATKQENEQEIARLRVALRDLIPSDAKDRDLQITVEVIEHEQPAIAILQVAERMNVDVVCVGATTSGVIANLLGSVAQAVVKNSLRPVLVAKPPFA